MLEIKPTNTFKKDLQRAKKRGLNLSTLAGIIDRIAHEQPLDEKHFDHSLTGKMKEYRECHIQPDWLLIYQIGNNVVILNRTGTHADLF